VIRPNTIITIEQTSSSDFPNRSDVFNIYLINESTFETSVDNLTDTGELIIPKNIYVYQGTKRVNWTNAILTSGNNPLLLRGDKIKIEWLTYYYAFESSTDTRKEKSIRNTVFEGFISSIDNSMPIRLKVENNMYLLKKLDAENKVWQGSEYSLEMMVDEMIKDTGFEVKTDGVASTIGEVTTIGATVAEVLAQLSDDYPYNFYFIGNQLKAGIFRYYPEGRQFHTFDFQRNIASSNLEFRRTEDVKVKLVAYSVEKFEVNETTQSGKKSKKKRRLQVTLGDSFGSTETKYFADVTSESDLRDKATAYFKKINYDGFKGDFDTFAIPLVKKGDVVTLVDRILPERNGSYMVKGVVYKGGVNGYRQTIEIDYKVSSNNTELQ
jgi:hypothetical protein